VRRPRRSTTQVCDLPLDRIVVQDKGHKDNIVGNGKTRELKGQTCRSSSDELEQDRLDGGYSSSGSSSRDSSVHHENDYRQMWMDKRKENEQLSEDVKSAQKELKNTRKKLEEALVVPCYSAALLSPRPGAAERAEKQGKLEKKELQEKLESIEAQMQELHSIKEENEALRTENRSLTLFISKMAASVMKSTRV